SNKAPLIFRLARLAVLPLLLLLVSLSSQAKPAIEIKVGITEYQHLEATYGKYEEAFHELSNAADQPVSFKFAIGTYEEVTDWYNKRLIDVAILSAVPMAELLS